MTSPTSVRTAYDARHRLPAGIPVLYARTVPRSTWDSWPDQARNIFRRARVVGDAEHRLLTWEEMR